MNIIIRKALPEEAERIIDINIEVWNSNYSEFLPQDIIDKVQVKDKERIERQKFIIQGSENVFVAEVDGEIVGYQSFGRSHDGNYFNSGEIYTAYILKEYQRLGIGRKLAVACMKELYDKGFRTLITKCLDGNPANEFHKSIGGTFVGQSDFEPLGILVGKENIYYHDDLEKSINHNIKLLKKGG